DGRRLVTVSERAGWAVEKGLRDGASVIGVVDVWDLDTGKRVHRLVEWRGGERAGAGAPLTPGGPPPVAPAHGGGPPPGRRGRAAGRSSRSRARSPCWTRRPRAGCGRSPAAATSTR